MRFLASSHTTYEGYHRYDPNFTWDPAEEVRLVRKADLMLLSECL
jgi:hypothetical protein